MKEQLIEEIERLRQEVDKLRQEKTERKHAQEALREPEERLRSLLENIPDFVITVDRNHKILMINRGIPGIVTVEQAIGTELYNYVEPAHHEIMSESLEKVFQTGMPERYEVLGMGPEGPDTAWYETRVSPNKLDGQVISVTLISSDITQRKRTEEESVRLSNAVRMSTDSIVISDLDAKIIDVNEATLKMYGTADKRDLIGKNPLALIAPEEREKALAGMKEVLGKGHVASREYHIITKDGGTVPVEMSVAIMKDADDKPAGFVAVSRDITERKQAEAQIRELSSAVEQSIDGIATGDLEPKLTYVNDAFARMHGYSSGEMIGMPVVNLHSEEQTDEFKKGIDHIKTKGSWIGEIGHVRKDGTVFPTQMSVTLLTDEQGKATGIAAVCRDITEREEAEQELWQSEKKYRTILENIEDGYFEVDLAGNFTFVNDSLCKIGGYTRDEMIGMNNQQYMDKEIAKRVYQLFNRIYTTGKPSKGADWEIMRKDGTKRFINCSVSLIRDAQGKRIGFRGIARDTTGWRKAEEEQRQNEVKYRTILDSIEHGYFEVDIRGNLTFFNDSMCEILGYPKNEMMGMNNRQYMDKENARKVYQTFNRVYTTGKPDRGIDWEIIRKDGTKRIVEASVFLVRDSEDEPTGFRGIVRDVTERRKAEAERKALEKQAQVAARLSTMGQMASGIVHEINNPLTSVVGFAEMLAQQDLPEDAREYARIINNEGNRLTSIANRLLSFARHQKPETVCTDINKLIEDTIELQAYQMSTGNIKVTTKLDPHLPQTMVDPGQLQQVFLNIILNARKELRAAHGGGKLLVKTQMIDNTIQISLKDDGPGIPKENLERIFNPFFTTKKVGEGTGLGLSICQRIITSHNGKLYARSTLGKGATFIIELPVVTRRRKTAKSAEIAADNYQRASRVGR